MAPRARRAAPPDPAHDVPFDLPGLAPVELERPRERIWPGIAKWTDYRGAHLPCDTCVKLIHEKGVTKAPPANPATKRRTGPNGVTHWCGGHAVTQRAMDDAAALEAKNRAAADLHAERAKAQRKTYEALPFCPGCNSKHAPPLHFEKDDYDSTF